MEAAAILLILAQAAPVDDWIRALGAERIEERGEAEEKLLALAKDAHDAVRLLERSGAPSTLRSDWRKILPEGEPNFDGDDATIRGRLRSQRVTIDMQNAPLTAILDSIGEITGLIFYIQASESDDLMITTKAKDLPVGRFLDDLLTPRGMTWQVQNRIVLIPSAAEAKKRAKLELYDVRDMTGEKSGESLADDMRKQVFPGEWKEADGKALTFRDGLLIVRNRPEAHHEIRRFLSAVRAGIPWVSEVEPSPRVAALVQKLEKGTDEERAKAGREIEELGGDVARACAALEKAEASPDPEVKARARSIRAAIAGILGGLPEKE